MLVDYLKILFAFHLALYHLKIMKLLPAMVRGEQTPAPAAGSSSTSRACRTAAPPGWPSGAPPPGSAGYPSFVRATFTVKKLDDLAEHLAKRGQLSRPPGGFFQVSDLLALLGQRYRKERPPTRPAG